MPAPVLRSQLVTFARQAAGFDVIGTSPDEFINDPEALGMVDRSVHALYDLLIEAHGQEYYLKRTTIAVVPIVSPAEAIFALPQDFYQLVSVAIQSPAFLGFVPIEPFMDRERAELMTQSVVGMYYPQMTRYRLRGEQAVAGNPPVTSPSALIEFLPTPLIAFTAFVWYVPTCARAAIGTLTNPDIFYDGINGWEDFIIYDVAAKMVIKEERDPGPYLAQRAYVEARIKALAGSRDQGMPEHVVDTRGWLRRASMGRIGGVRNRLWYP